MRRWIRFAHGDETLCGTLLDDDQGIRVYDGPRIGEGRPDGRILAHADVTLLTPVVAPKFIGLWNNFGELATRLGQGRPEEPLYFLKSANSYLAPGGIIRAPLGYAGRIFYEGELGIVIGSSCRGITEDAAPAHILGYTCVNDVTAFDLLNRDPSFAQWARAKSCDTFGPFGPTVAEGLDWSELRVRTLVDGRERQNYPARDMILPPARIVSLISREVTLEPGDVIACGTSVGALPMKPGATVEVSIEGIGTLSNTLETNA
jgi:2-keto-4-pentenoate hydratase/2-oxohepta-3-ene-1,7-dioic acid hydratase in catechol pathway